MKKAEKKTGTKPPIQKSATKQLNYWPYLIGILVLTFIVFLPSLMNGFIEWDDPEYTYKNPYIKDLDLAKIFGNFYFSNYHPLTIVSYCLEYKFFGISAKMFHLDNILIHLCNVTFVFFIAKRLFKGKIYGAAITALLFAIHPMHVESVTWISERKDVLYTFFYLAAIMTYLMYLQHDRKLLYLGYTFILMLLSMFSKGQAVTLPIVLLLIDYLMENKLKMRYFLEKIPFLAMSLLFGYLAIKAQGESEAINTDYSGINSLFFGTYGLFLYVSKFFLPINLSGLHPYPSADTRAFSPLLYAAPAILLVFLFVIIKTYKTKKEIAFGTLFFLVTIFPLLKFLPVGDTIIAERYTYIPYIGLFFIVGYFFNKALTFSEWKKYAKASLVAVALVTVYFGITSFNRTKIYLDNQTFWGNVREQYPNYWRANQLIGYDNYQKGNFDKALEYFNTAIEKDKYCPPIPYSWRGITLLDHFNKPREAIRDFNKLLSMIHSPKEQIYTETMLNLGLAYYRIGVYDSAFLIYDKMLVLTPNDPTLYYDRGLAYTSKKDYDSAIIAYNKAMELKPDYTDAILGRGILYTDRLNKFPLGIEDFKKVLQYKPNDKDANADLGIALYKNLNFEAAVQQFTKVIALSPDNGNAYYLRAVSYGELKQYDKALSDGLQARKMGIKIGDDLLQRWSKK
ncbi:MAG: tetratricopeptide repeat protein [Bacteroidota bacterium]